MPDGKKPADARWIQRFDNFKRAFARLAEAAALARRRKLSELEKQGLVKAFEFTHELAWNTFKDFLTARGTSEKLYGSKDATREAFAAGLIENGEAWMKMIEHRNETSHTYNENVAETIVEAILSVYAGEFEKFQRQFEKLKLEGAG